VQGGRRSQSGVVADWLEGVGRSGERSAGMTIIGPDSAHVVVALVLCTIALGVSFVAWWRAR